MNKKPSRRIALDLIDVGQRLRVIDMDWATFLAGSMAEEGQLQDIEVREKKGGRFALTAGAHRLEAAKINRWPDIGAAVVNVSDLQAQLREIDENLVRRDLSALDRATALARRQEVYLELHPETAQGKAGAAARWMQGKSFSFALEMAAKLDVSGRSIRMAIRRYQKIAPDIREKIATTWIADKGIELDALTRLGAAEQRKVVRLMLQEAHPAKSVAAALKALSGEMDEARDVDVEQYNRLVAAWKKSGAKARARFIKFLAEQPA